MTPFPNATDLAHAWGSPQGKALFKQNPEDFRVDEILGFEPGGEGEHVLWQVEKSGLSTHELVSHIASRLNLPHRQLSWSGMKDKQAVTTQWIGLHVGVSAEPDFEKVENEKIRVLQSIRNQKKLRIGVHQGNRFRIHLKQFQGDLDLFNDTVKKISSEGVPNYFGAQRFGFQGMNIEKARQMFTGERRVTKRSERSILLSAARAWLFNEVLSRRVTDGSWNRMVAGDVMALEASKAGFTPLWAELSEDERLVLQQRLEQGDIHPTGPLWGKGASPVSGDAANYEKPDSFPDVLCKGLESAGMTQERRSLRMQVYELEVEPDRQGGLMVEFRLGRGGYATSLLRELVSVQTDAGSFFQTRNQ